MKVRVVNTAFVGWWASKDVDLTGLTYSNGDTVTMPDGNEYVIEKITVSGARSPVLYIRPKDD